MYNLQFHVITCQLVLASHQLLNTDTQRVVIMLCKIYQYNSMTYRCLFMVTLFVPFHLLKALCQWKSGNVADLTSWKYAVSYNFHLSPMLQSKQLCNRTERSWIKLFEGRDLSVFVNIWLSWCISSLVDAYTQVCVSIHLKNFRQRIFGTFYKSSICHYQIGFVGCGSIYFALSLKNKVLLGFM